MPSEEAKRAAAEIVPTFPPVYLTQEEVAAIIDRAIKQAVRAERNAALNYVDPPGTPYGCVDTKPEGR